MKRQKTSAPDGPSGWLARRKPLKPRFYGAALEQSAVQNPLWALDENKNERT